MTDCESYQATVIDTQVGFAQDVDNCLYLHPSFRYGHGECDGPGAHSPCDPMPSHLQDTCPAEQESK